MASFLDQYKKITALPFGSFLFNKAIGFVAPFFATIKPNIVTLEPGLCVVEMKDRRAIRNHIGTVNAGALCTVAELTGGMALDASIPPHLRWLPKAMSVSYLKKARGMLRATCALEPAMLDLGDVILHISVKDANAVEVFTADITFYVSKKKNHS